MSPMTAALLGRCRDVAAALDLAVNPFERVGAVDLGAMLGGSSSQARTDDDHGAL